MDDYERYLKQRRKLLEKNASLDDKESIRNLNKLESQLLNPPKYSSNKNIYELEREILYPNKNTSEEPCELTSLEMKLLKHSLSKIPPELAKEILRKVPKKELKKNWQTIQTIF